MGKAKKKTEKKVTRSTVEGPTAEAVPGEQTPKPAIETSSIVTDPGTPIEVGFVWYDDGGNLGLQKRPIDKGD